MINNKLVLAYIGNGKSANRYHLPFVLQRSDKFIVKKIFDIRIRHDLWKTIDGVEYVEDVNKILNDPKIDMVVICTAHHLHYDYAKMVLNAGKHCLVEIGRAHV